MKQKAKITLWMLGLTGLLLTTACQGEEVAGTCKRASDCETGFFCGEDFMCHCESDNSCAENEFCNASGSCQMRMGCRMDADCGEPGAWRCEISDNGMGQCLCQTDAACADKEFCNTSGSCQKKVGCILDADCGNAADWTCSINQDTKIGECFCKTDNACEQGDFCNAHNFCQPIATCEKNEDCPTGRFCDADSGECLCSHEAQTGCGADQVCNATGYCQPRPGCYENLDCEHLAGTFCDLTSRTCIAEGKCTSSLQCPLATVCRQGDCVTGCDDHNDCSLSQRCQNFTCVDGCQSDDFCDLAEYCMDGDADGTYACESATTTATPYCKPCRPTIFNPVPDCGSPRNECIIYNNGPDDFSAQHDQYCAMDCSADQRCPAGFDCGDLIIIKSECGGTCGSTVCDGGLPCLQSEESECGHCPCNDTTARCPANECVMNKCSATAKECSETKPCQQFECIKYEGKDYGYCLYGRVCGLKEGFHCPVP